MKVVDTKGNVIDLNQQANPNELIGGLLSGQLLADANSTYKIKAPSGKIFDVPASDLGDILKAGGTFYGAQEQAKATEEEKFAGIPQQAAAAGLGALRGTTLGLSDLALTKTGLVSPEYLQKQEEYNPEIATAGEVAGMVLPAILTGGESVAAKVLSKTPAALVPKLGVAAGELVSPIAKAAGRLSPIASKAVETAVKAGIGSGVEGAVYGLGKTISEDAIQDKPFTAEAALANMGTGALINGLIGTGLGFTGELAVEGAKKAISKLSSAAGDEKLQTLFMLKSLGASKRDTDKILSSKYKTELLNDGYKILNSNIDLIPQEVGERAGVSAKGFTELAEEAKKTPISLENLTENVDQTIQKAQKYKKQAIDAMENSLEQVQSLTDTREVLKALDQARTAIGDFDFTTQERMRNFLDKMKDTISYVNEDGKRIYQDLSAKELQQLNLKIKDVIKKERAYGLTGWAETPFTEALAEGSRAIEKDLEMMLETTSGRVHSDYKAAKRVYGAMADIENLAEGLQAKTANNVLSLTDMLAGGAGASVAGVPGALVGAGARKLMREYGDKALVTVLTQLEKNSGSIASTIDDSIKGLFTAGKTAGAIATVKGVEAADKHESYEDKLNRFTNNANSIENVKQRLDQSLVGLGAAAPETALALRNKTLNAMEFLASKMPKHPVESSMVKYQIPESELDKFNRYSEAVNNPRSIIKNLKGGYISPEEVEVLKKVYPEINQKLQTAAVDALSKKNKEINYQLRLQLQKLMDNKQEVNMFPRGVMTLQNSFAGQAPGQAPGQMPVPSQKLPGARAKNMNLSGVTDSGLQATLKRRND